MPPKNHDEPIEESIRREMTIKPLDIESILAMKPRLDEEQLDSLTPANRSMILSIALIEERLIATLKVSEQIFEHLMHIEANQIRDRISNAAMFKKLTDDQNKLDGWAVIIRWSCGVAVAGMIAAVVKTAIDKLWK